MILYFSDRKMQVLGLASTNLPEGYIITEDLKTEDIEAGVATFSCKIGYGEENRLALEEMTEAGNYLLRSHEDENEFYTIIDTEIDTKNKCISIYAEDAGLDLLNEIAGEFEAPDSYNSEWYINKYILDSGFEIGINEIPTSTKRKLSWEGEETVTARLASIATQFGGYEISYSFDIKGLQITNKYVNIHKERGKDEGVMLRLDRDIDKIITTKSVANLATAFVCEGGVPDNEEEAITFSSKGYTWKDNDGDFFIEGDLLKSKKANEKWSRYVWNKEPNKLTNGDGYIVRPYSYNTTDPATLRAHAVTELKKVCDVEINYEIDVNKLPDGVKIGDRINIVDDAGELYVSTRILLLETSIVDQEQTATLGEHLIKTSGISQKVADLAAQFAKNTVSVKRALSVANAAKVNADEAKEQAETAATSAEGAQAIAEEAKVAANSALQSSEEATAKALAAEAAVDKVEESVASLEITVENAEKVANDAQAAANTATQKAEEASTAASNAETVAGEAKSASEAAQASAESASTKADGAIAKADDAKALADSASETAAAAKLDAQQAEADVAAFGESLETYKATMEADYARKTELTETTASLQSQITANANQLSITHSKVVEVDETANDAKSKAEAAQTAASTAQSQADQATADAQAAQTAANTAAAAAESAQSKADTAKAAAESAQSVADKAEADLEAAKADLATVSGRVDATEEEIIAAQAAVDTAQAAADKAQADADAAAQKATDAQTVANNASTTATNAQNAANEAANQAALAQQAADEAKGDAASAQAKANEAAQTAAEAQATADTAKANAASAQSKANQAALDAANAQQAADDADAKAVQAQADLTIAQNNLASVTSRVDATEEEIAAAEEAVAKAQKAADDADSAAKAAQSTADTAKANAATAQTAANNAKTAADNAQAAADKAKAAADKAQEDVDALTIRVTTAETEITKNAEAIKLAATKTEVTQTLGGYYTKEEADAAIQVKANEITSSVSNTYATKQEVDDIEIGGRNLLFNSKGEFVSSTDANYGFWNLASGTYSHGIELKADQSYTLSFDWSVDWGEVTPVTYVMVSVGCGSTAGAFSYDIGATTLQNLSTETSGSVVFTFTPKATDLIDRPYFAMRPIRTNSADTLDGTTWTIKNVKLEKGDKATDWTPAPEDVDEDIGAAQNTADDAITTIATMQSTIQQLADSIAMLVRDGNGGSLIKQDSSGLYYFDIGGIEKGIADTANEVDALTGLVYDANGEIDVLKSTAAALQGRTEYIRSYTDENDRPCLELGEGDSAYKAYVTNTGIDFKNGTSLLATISRQMLVVEKALLRNELQIGDDEDTTVGGVWIWKQRSNGNLGLMWKGVNS